MTIETLQAEFMAAADRRNELEARVRRELTTEVVEALFIARREEDDKRAELQKAMWLEINEIDSGLAA